MRSERTVKKAIKAIGAKAVNCITTEQWVDKDGKLYNIDRSPTEWKKVGKPRDTEVYVEC